MYIAPSSDHEWLNLNLPFKLILMRFEIAFYVWNKNVALFKGLMEIHSNPPSPILYYGFKNVTERQQI